MACKGSGVRIPLAPFLQNPYLLDFLVVRVSLFGCYSTGQLIREALELKYFIDQDHIMSDRNIDQINHNLDQVLLISADNTRNIAELHQSIANNSHAIGELRETVATVAGAVETLARLTDQRLNRQDQIISMLSSYITGVSPANEEPS
jgi:predicted ATP-grasp superfamily ATP-dependent carboligase